MDDSQGGLQARVDWWVAGQGHPHPKGLVQVLWLSSWHRGTPLHTLCLPLCTRLGAVQ